MLVSRPVKAVEDNVAAGIGWMLVTTFFFVSLDSLAKVMLQSYPLVEVVWARFLFHLLFVSAVMGRRFGSMVRSGKLSLQLVRSVLLFTTTLLFFAGVHLVPLAEASAIMFLTPILVTALSVPLLREAVGPRRWAGVAIGFCGALIIVRPASGFMELGALILLVAATTNASYQIITRQLRAIDSPLTTLFYSALPGAVVFSLAVPFFWVTPRLLDWGLFLAMGICGGLGHLCLIKAFRAAPAAVVAPVSYVSLIWAIGYGFVIFGDLPDLWTLVGAGIIAASGLYILHREQVRKRAPAPTAAE